MRASALGGASALVPVKAFSASKRRLAGALDAAARAELSRWMAGRVLAAAAPLGVTVVCDDDEVASWASNRGAEVLWTPGLGLVGAVQAGVAHLAAAGAEHVVVAHADLPLAVRLAHLVPDALDAAVVLVPDLVDDGTNVAVVPAGAGFRFSYGARSFARHSAEAERLGLELRVVRDPALQADVDTPADLRHLATPA